MKELIDHRHFLPAVNRYRDKLAVIDGAYRATFNQHAGRVFRADHVGQEIVQGNGARHNGG